MGPVSALQPQEETPLLLSKTASSSVQGLPLAHGPAEVLPFPLSGGLTQKDEVDVNFQLGCRTGLISRPCSGSGGVTVKD